MSVQVPPRMEEKERGMRSCWTGRLTVLDQRWTMGIMTATGGREKCGENVRTEQMQQRRGTAVKQAREAESTHGSSRKQHHSPTGVLFMNAETTAMGNMSLA